jgi:hypothetical protein
LDAIELTQTRKRIKIETESREVRYSMNQEELNQMRKRNKKKKKKEICNGQPMIALECSDNSFAEILEVEMYLER